MTSNKIGIQGETLPLILNYKLDGVLLENATLDNIELQILEEGAEGSLKLTLENGRISVPSGETKYQATLTQAETLALPQTVNWQIKILRGAEAIADDYGTFTLGRALSSTPLTSSD